MFDGGGPRGVVERRFVLDRRLSGVDGGSDGTLNMMAGRERAVERLGLREESGVMVVEALQGQDGIIIVEWHELGSRDGLSTRTIR